ncbi:MAG: NAD(P)/FAD-dependent oxidoreductase [Burkholderiales bacterium]|nr:NAD(P)/FAD-dependent oxidoreductase [Burkholderiales bacterium]
MSGKTQVDVLVIGLGPAGGASAAASARAGLSVLAVERKAHVGVPVQCAEFIPLPLGKYAQAEGVLVQHIAGMKNYLPSGMTEKAAFPGLMIDRAAFDQALAREAEALGAELCLASRLLRLDARHSIATIQTPEGEREVGYRLLIAADGPYSTVASQLGLAPLETVFTRQYTVPLLQPYDDTDIWLSDEYPGGYAWLFPKGECANLGVGADKDYTHDLKQPLDALHARLVNQGVVGDTILSLTGGLIPVGGLRARLVVDKTLFVGDAAGLTHPITGAGIAAALVSGECAGQAAARYLLANEADALNEFEAEIRDQFEMSLARAVARRQWLNQRWHTAAACEDAMHRKGWIAFPEYFEKQIFTTEYTEDTE